jgi:hypothetical protein
LKKQTFEQASIEQENIEQENINYIKHYISNIEQENINYIKHYIANIENLFPFAANDEPACSPRDFLNSTPYFSDAIYSPHKGGDECLPRCFRREYFTKITEAQIDPGAILRYANVTGTNKLGDPE